MANFSASEMLAEYTTWKCGFSTTAAIPITPTPSNPGALLDTIEQELKTCSSVELGLKRYIEVIRSGEHFVFSEAFLQQQSNSSLISLEQLTKIHKHLSAVAMAIKADDQLSVQDEIRETVHQARAWIAKTRAIVVDSHVFYKINYSMVADKKVVD